MGRALGSHSAVLDGEIVALDSGGRPSFEALQQRMQLGSRAQAARRAKSTPVTYVIFDLLWLDGHSLMGLPYSERRARLAALALSGESWRTPEHVVGHGAALLAASAEQGLEGIVAKRLDSAYQPGLRSRDWLKIKRFGRQEFVIGGWMPGKGRRSSSVGALLLGVYEPAGALRYVGRVGSGFSDAELERLARPAGAARARAVALRRRPTPTARRDLLRAAARRRGRVRRVDRRWEPAPAHLQGPARGQGADRGPPRGHRRRAGCGDRRRSRAAAHREAGRRGGARPDRPA